MMLGSVLGNIKKHISKVGMVITVVIAALIMFFAIREVKTARTLIGLPLEQYKRAGSTLGSRRANVQLTAEQFDPATAVFAGTAKVTIAPYRTRNADGNVAFPAGEPEQTQAIESVVLSLGHAEKVENETAIIEQGNSEEVELKHTLTRPDVTGIGKFTWKAQRLRPSFWYPFDSYLLYVNPSLLVPTKDDAGVGYGVYEYIETLEVELSVPNLSMNLNRNPVAKPFDDPYEVKFKRPLVLRIITIVIGVLALGWLIYLALFAETGSYVGQILTFFLGIWGVRTTLLAGLSVFPVMLDYATLTLSVVAVGIVISKWMQERLSITTRECPHCKMKIPLEAHKCPYCTAGVA